MQQLAFPLPVKVRALVDSSAFGFDGCDLKVIARGVDGYDYACKRLTDGSHLPIAEWVGYHLWNACGLHTPEFAVLHLDNPESLDPEPAFGSRIEVAALQVDSKSPPWEAAQFFAKHKDHIQRNYPLDAFFSNYDRHGRNFIVRKNLGTGQLLSMDFSRSWLCNGLPFGDVHHMERGNSRPWWNFFKKSLSCTADDTALKKLLALPDEWLEKTLASAPNAWISQTDADNACRFWQNGRDGRALFALNWSHE